jgi:hypothetical protein
MVIKGATNQEEFEPVYFQYFESDKRSSTDVNLNTEGLTTMTIIIG